MPGTDQKRLIAHALSNSKDEAVKSYLLEQLDQAPNSEIRLELFKACINCKALPWPNLLNKLIWDADIKITYVALELLGDTRDKSLKQAIYSILDSDPDSQLHAYAIKALGKYQDEEDLPLIMNLVNNSNDKILQAAALEALGHFPPSKALTTLTRYANSRDELLLKAIIESLSIHKATSELIKLLYSQNVTPALKLDIIGSLKDLEEKASIITLIKKLKDPNVMVKVAAGRALNFADFSAVEPIIEAIGEVPPFYHRIFIDTLTEIAQNHRDEFISYSERQIKNKVLDMAMIMINGLDHPEMNDWIGRYLRLPPNKNDVLFNNIQKVLSKHHEEDPLFNYELVLDVLRDPNQDIRTKALKFFEKNVFAHKATSLLVEDDILCILIEIIGNIKARSFENLICHLLSHPADRIKSACLIALGYFRSTKAEPYLKMLIAHDDVNIRIKAIECVGVIGIKLMVHDLIALLAEEATPPKVRLAVIKALGECGIKWAAEILRKQLHNKDKAEIIAAIEALAKLHEPESIEEVKALISKSNDADISIKALETTLKLGGDIPLQQIAELINHEDKKFASGIASVLQYHHINEDFMNFLMTTLIDHKEHFQVFKALLETMVKINDESLYNKLFTYYSAI